MVACATISHVENARGVSALPPGAANDCALTANHRERFPARKRISSVEIRYYSRCVLCRSICVRPTRQEMRERAHLFATTSGNGLEC
jgi:hypothetical protein